MSSGEQENVLHLLGLLLKHKSTGKLFGWLIGLTTMLAVTGTIFSYNFLFVHYVDELNYAKRVARPVAVGLVQTRDSLNIKAGFNFKPLEIDR